MARPLGDLNGRTPQADDLALWVRKVTRQVTARELEKMFPHSKSTWTGLRNGTRLPDAELVDDLVDELIREPRLRESLRKEGHKLRREAEAAEEDLKAGRPLPARVPEKRSETTTALLRLDDARLQQLEAMRRLAASEKRCVQLEGMVSVLQDQCVQLRAERDRARQEARAEVEQLQRALERSQELHQQADAQLAHARRAAGHAYELRVAAEEKASEAKAAARHALNDEPDTTGTLLPPEALEPTLPPLDRMADALDQAAAELAEQDQELDELREDLGLHHRPTDTPASTVVPGAVVAANPTPASGAEQSTSSAAADHHLADDTLTAAAAPVAVVSDNKTDREDNVPTRSFSKHSAGSFVRPLAKVRTPEDLTQQLWNLRARAGRDVWTWDRMAETTLDGAKIAESPDRLYAWFFSRKLPAPRPGFLALVTVLGADEDEQNAFLAAHKRTEAFVASPVRRTLVAGAGALVLLSALMTSLATSAVVYTDPTPPSGPIGTAIAVYVLITLLGGVALAFLTRGMGKGSGTKASLWLAAIFGTWITCVVLTRLLGTAVGLGIADAIGLL
ncbi:hypothetical protein ACFQ8W_24725 [Streptomyces sp. NPDC056508]|uniref:hypothetical protein n=1 Tax=Streptomyces sp. NPDC056508 TaxID=3345845 RepID=UPI0036C48246